MFEFRSKTVLLAVAVPLGILAACIIVMANSCPIGEYPLSTGYCMPDDNYTSGSITGSYIQQLQQQISEYQSKLAQDTQILANDQYKLDNSNPMEADRAAGACNLDWKIPRGGCDALYQKAQQAATDWNYANSHLGMDKINVNNDKSKLEELNARLENANAFMLREQTKPAPIQKQTVVPPPEESAVPEQSRSQEEKQNSGVEKQAQPSAPKSAASQGDAKQGASEAEDQGFTTSTESEAMLDLVSGKHKNEIASIKEYYSQKPFFIPATDKEYAQNQLDQTRSLGTEVVNSKNDYQDASNKGASRSEVADLKNSYNTKLQDLKSQLRDILSIDSENSDALWQLGTLSKWEGDNKGSYENYRNALVSEKSRNPFKYQKLLDSIKDPAIRTEILRNMEPNENIVELPTIKNSPILMELKSNLGALLQPITAAKQTAVENIEKISRAFSLSDKLDKVRKELGITE